MLQVLILELLCFLSLKTLTNALSLPLTLPIIQNPDNTSSSSLPSELILNVTSKPEAMCNKGFGSIMEQGSCRNAWEKIERTTETRVYRRRDQAQAQDISLPMRLLSDDGKCAIDIDIRSPVKSVILDSEALSDSVGDVLVNCVFKSGVGGTILVPGKPIISIERSTIHVQY